MKRSGRRKKVENSNLNLGAGRSIEAPIRHKMESYFHFDFSEVRIYHDERHGQLADDLSSDAFTIGQSIVFGRGKYNPSKPEGKELLAHELGHVVQQHQKGSNPEAEHSAQQSSREFALGKEMNTVPLGKSPIGIQKQEKDKDTPKDQENKPGSKEVKVDVKNEDLVKAPKEEKIETPQKKLPSRLPIEALSTDNFKIGLRLGFPSLAVNKSRFAPDPLKETLRRGKLINQTLTGKVPSGWESTDKRKIAEAAWGIFSKHIAPDFAKKVTSGLNTSTSTKDMSYELDATLITNFSTEIGGGLSFTLKWK